MAIGERHACLALALVAGLTIGGCSVVSRDGREAPEYAQVIGVAPPAEQSAESEISALASFGDTLSLLEPESQRQELGAAERDLERIDSSVQRLRLALVLILADQDLQDLERARVLLAESVVVPEHPAHVGLAKLLAILVAELQVERQAGQQAVQAAEQRQQQHGNVKLAEERAQCQALEERLARLKDIEKQMNERAQPSTLTIDDDDEPTENPARRR